MKIGAKMTYFSNTLDNYCNKAIPVTKLTVIVWVPDTRGPLISPPARIRGWGANGSENDALVPYFMAQLPFSGKNAYAPLPMKPSVKLNNWVVLS